MSSKGSPSPSRSPSPLPSQEAREVEKKEEKETKEKSESPESTSDASKSSSSDDGAARESSSSNETTPNEPSTSNSAERVEAPPVVSALVQGDWQAIWSPQHGMYYFHNLRTNETTWTNPLVPSDASATRSTTTSTYMSAQEAAAAAAGIDPELAYLDPSLAAGPSAPAAFSYTAKFNARTGAFAKPDARNPEHVSEYERMRRMNSFYFDMDAWQQEVEKRHEEEEAEAGKKRKKPTKKDLESFRERKKQKKLAKTAWLRI